MRFDRMTSKYNFPRAILLPNHIATNYFDIYFQSETNSIAITIDWCYCCAKTSGDVVYVVELI